MLGKECRSSYVVYPIFTHLHRCDRSVLLPDRNELFTAAFDRQGSRGAKVVCIFFFQNVAVMLNSNHLIISVAGNLIYVASANE